MDWVKCFWCGTSHLKDIRHINENKKLGHKFYCSPKCQILTKSKKVELTCDNPNCHNKFKRKPKDVSPNNYCSRSCSVTVNNKKFPKRVAMVRNCSYCDKRLSNYRKYCSIECKSNALTLAEDKVIERIRRFYIEHGRIPVKREVWGIYKPARKYFATWNNAIKAAGFKPNPVIFADKCIANDGHICDSVAEKIIDDYLSENGIVHERHYPYPGGIYTADFKIGNIVIEYFGLAGEHKRYDELRTIKQNLVRRYKLQMLEIYPQDLYPKNNLENILRL